jgi:hypothetical protein
MALLGLEGALKHYLLLLTSWIEAPSCRGTWQPEVGCMAVNHGLT